MLYILKLLALSSNKPLKNNRHI